MGLGFWDIAVIIGIIIAALAVGLYFLNKWAGKKMVQQQDAVERSKQTVSLYVIDKKKEKITNAHFPKAIYEQMPRWSRMMKMPLVKAKIGPQIATLMCDNKVFPVLPVKKTVAVELAGMYIVGMRGMKTKQEMEAIRKARKGDAEIPQKWHQKLLSKFKK